MTEDTDSGIAHRLSLAEHAAQKAQHELLRTKVIHTYDIDPEDAEALLTATDEDTLIRQAERISTMPSRERPLVNHVPREGGNPSPHPTSNTDLRQVARQLFDGNFDPL